MEYSLLNRTNSQISEIHSLILECEFPIIRDRELAHKTLKIRRKLIRLLAPNALISQISLIFPCLTGKRGGAWFATDYVHSQFTARAFRLLSAGLAKSQNTQKILSAVSRVVPLQAECRNGI